MDAVARGRVWTGAQALSLGLVDRLGGLDDAHRLAAELAGLPAKRLPPLVEYPKSQSLVEKLGAALSEDKSDGLSAAPSAGGGWAGKCTSGLVSGPSSSRCRSCGGGRGRTEPKYGPITGRKTDRKCAAC